MDKTENKISPQLIFQIWDNDKFSFDDYLGKSEGVGTRTPPDTALFVLASLTAILRNPGLGQAKTKQRPAVGKAAEPCSGSSV